MLRSLHLGSNAIVDLTPLESLTALETLTLDSNQISDISELIDNPGLDSADIIDLTSNPLSEEALDVQIPALEERGVVVLR